MKKFFIKFIIWIGGLVCLFQLTGCLMTRDEISEQENRKAIQHQVSTLQKTNADAQSKYTEINEDMRELSGKVEALENRVQVQQQTREKAQQLSDQQLVEANKKIALLQEEIQRLENQVGFLNQELTKLSANQVANTSSSSASEKGKVDHFKEGEEALSKKQWKEAILNFQKYRDTYPSGKKQAQATYKIGYAFQQLGMKEEAKTFFEEVLSKYSDSAVAKLAKAQLKKK